MSNISKAVGVCITREPRKAIVSAVEHRRGGCTFFGQSADPSYSVIFILELPLAPTGAAGSDGVGNIISPVSGVIPPMSKPRVVVPFSGPLAACLRSNIHIIHREDIYNGLRMGSWGRKLDLIVQRWENNEMRRETVLAWRDLPTSVRKPYSASNSGRAPIRRRFDFLHFSRGPIGQNNCPDQSKPRFEHDVLVVCL